MPCEKQTQRCDLDYWRKREDTPACCIRHLKEIMADVDKTLREQQIPYWLDYGSLLGAHREGTIIAWDTDLDIGMFASDLPRLNEAFKMLSASYSISTCLRDHYYRVNYSRTNLVHCDIWVFHPIEGGKLSCKSLGPKEDFEASWVERFKEIPFNGIPSPIPDDPERMLDHRYGPTWKTPLRHWKPK